MKLLFCLGNPGSKYQYTRHNAGFLFADLLVQKIGGSFFVETKFKSEIAKCVYNDESIWVVKPQTFMNLSGEALLALRNFYKLNIDDLFLVYDDISMEIGKIRFRAKGSSGGHNGIKSIIKYAQTEAFPRLKIGIGLQPPYMKSEDYVLQKFSNEEMKLLNQRLS